MNDDPRIDPADLRNVRFPGSSRRYDARAVDQFLETVADRIAATNDLVDDLRRRLAEAEAATAAPAPAPVASELSTLDEDELVRLIGEETATVLSTARRAAEEIRSKAEESAARVIREATAEADRVRDEAKARASELTSDAEAALDRATTEAEAAAARIRDEAAAEVERISEETAERVESELAAIEARSAEAQAEAERIVAEAREEGRGMVAEAKEVRARILEDLQRRRDLARDHIERLLAGRERLLAAYGLVRENLDDITGQLADSLPDPGEPELPDGFVGIVGSTVADDAEASDDEAPAEETPEPAVDDAGDAADEVDDTVAPAVAPEAEGGPSDEPAAEEEPPVLAEDDADHPVADEGEDEAPEEVAAAELADLEPSGPGEESSGEESGGEEPGGEEPSGEEPLAEEATEPTGDVDALFARLRAEREQSVARAQQVLESDADADADADGDTDTDTAPADEQAGPEPGEEATAVADAGDVEHIPAEYLAPPDDLARRSDALGALDDQLNRALKRRLADEQNELLDLLRRSGSTEAAELLPAEDGQVGSYADVAQKHLAAAASAGVEAAGAAPMAVDVSGLAQSLGATLVEPFRRRFERSAAEVDDADELDERLRALYREWKVQHIGPAAEDALLSAYALGTLTGARPDGQVRWCIDPAQGPCPDAEDNALAGLVDVGEPFPTGDACPQAHPGCRCLLVAE